MGRELSTFQEHFNVFIQLIIESNHSETAMDTCIFYKSELMFLKSAFLPNN